MSNLYFSPGQRNRDLFYLLVKDIATEKRKCGVPYTMMDGGVQGCSAVKGKPE